MVQTRSGGIRFRGRFGEHIDLTLEDDSPPSRPPPPPLRKQKLQTTGGRLVKSKISSTSASSAPTVCRRLLPPPSSSDDSGSIASAQAEDEAETLSPLSILPLLLSHQVIPSPIILDFTSYFPLLVPATLLHVHHFTIATPSGQIFSSLHALHLTHRPTGFLLSLPSNSFSLSTTFHPSIPLLLSKTIPLHAPSLPSPNPVSLPITHRSLSPRRPSSSKRPVPTPPPRGSRRAKCT